MTTIWTTHQFWLCFNPLNFQKLQIIVCVIIPFLILPVLIKRPNGGHFNHYMYRNYGLYLLKHLVVSLTAVGLEKVFGGNQN